MKLYLWVFLGGGIGSALRFALSKIRFTSCDFPVSTLIINTLGSFLIAYLGMKFMRNSTMQMLFIAGFCGGFTTFSTFSMEALSFLKEGRLNFFTLYVLSSVFLGLLSAYLGIIAAHKL